MPSGEAQKVWLEEMLSSLSLKWNRDLSWEQCADLCSEMTEYRKELRKEKNIKSIKMRCPKCDRYTDWHLSPISIRSMLFALRKASIIDERELKDLDQAWKKYQRKSKLNCYCKPKAQKLTNDKCNHNHLTKAFS